MKVMILSNSMSTSSLTSRGLPVVICLSISIAVCIITFDRLPLLLHVSSRFGSKRTACTLAPGGVLLLGFLGATCISTSGMVSLVGDVLGVLVDVVNGARATSSSCTCVLYGWLLDVGVF